MDTCNWRLECKEDSSWETSCGLMYQFMAGGPKDNSTNFCPQCGKPIEVVGEIGKPALTYDELVTALATATATINDLRNGIENLRARYCTQQPALPYFGGYSSQPRA